MGVFRLKSFPLNKRWKIWNICFLKHSASVAKDNENSYVLWFSWIIIFQPIIMQNYFYLFCIINFALNYICNNYDNIQTSSILCYYLDNKFLLTIWTWNWYTDLNEFLMLITTKIFKSLVKNTNCFETVINVIRDLIIFYRDREG